MSREPKILVCPLDWGIGHATRMVPVIRELIRQHCQVIIGASGRPLAFLKAEFPGLTSLEIPGPEITYPDSGKGMVWNMIRQFPALIGSIRREHELLRGLIDEYGIDGVISDNRYGLHSGKIPCIFITHQVFIMTPAHLRYLAPPAHRMIRGFIRKFMECWIPDTDDDQNLSGDLSHKKPLPPEFHFIGPLSRFAGIPVDVGTPKYDILAILSGPEPQRTILENTIIREIGKLGLRAVMVLGKPDGGKMPAAPDHCSVFNHLGSEALIETIQKSKIVVSRSGYSTIMDMAATGKKAILIPTPGQTEQEYLGRYHMEKGHYYSCPQEKFNLGSAMQMAGNYSGLKLQENNKVLENRITRLLKMIKP